MKRFLLVFTLSILVVVVAPYWRGGTGVHADGNSFQASASPAVLSGTRPAVAAVWTATIEGSVDSPPPPDHFSAVYSGEFTFTVNENDDRTLTGSGIVRKTYTISEWSCPTVQNTLQGSIGVSGSVDPTYNMVTLVFSVTQPSQAADESCSGISEHIYGATDGFEGLTVNMRYGSGEVSPWISQLACCSDQIRFRLGIVTYQTTSTTSSPTTSTSSAPGQLQVNILGCPSTVKSGDSVQLSTKWGATSPPDLALPNPTGQLSYSWAADAGTFSSRFDSMTTWWAPSVDSETQVTVAVQISAPSYSSARDSCVITVEPQPGHATGYALALWGGLAAGGLGAIGSGLASKRKEDDDKYALTIYVDKGEGHLNGHVFVGLKGPDGEIFRGFYSEDRSLAKPLFGLGGGEVLDDAVAQFAHLYNTSYTWKIRPEGYKRAYDYIQTRTAMPGNWSPNNHCGDFAAEVADQAGVPLYLTPVKMLGGGRRPTLFGEYLEHLKKVPDIQQIGTDN